MKTTTLSVPLKIGALAALLFLSACGGGGDGGTADASSSNSASQAGTSTGPKKDLPTDPAARLARVKSDVNEAAVYVETDGTMMLPRGLQGVETSSAGHGSGFIMTSDGLVVTNAHVAVGQGIYRIYLNSRDRPISAQLHAIAECEDLAVLKMISGAPFPTLSWSVNPPGIGMRVAVTGFPGDVSATQVVRNLYTYNEGVVNTGVYQDNTSWSSADMFYHSADTASGNSGGPVIEVDTGTVVGVHYAGITMSGGTRRNMALSSTTARDIVNNLLAGKDVLSIGISGEVFYGYLDASKQLIGYGLSTQAPSQATSRVGLGVWVRGVAPGGKAVRAGILPGDIITDINGAKLEGDDTMRTYCDAMRSGNPNGGTPVKFEIIRPKAGGATCEGELNGRVVTAKGTLTTACPETAPTGSSSSSSASSSSGSVSSSASGSSSSSSSGSSSSSVSSSSSSSSTSSASSSSTASTANGSYSGTVGSLGLYPYHSITLVVSGTQVTGSGAWLIDGKSYAGDFIGSINSSGAIDLEEEVWYEGDYYYFYYTGTLDRATRKMSGVVADDYGRKYNWSAIGK